VNLTKKNSIGKIFSGNYVIPSREENFLFETIPSMFFSWLQKNHPKNTNAASWVEADAIKKPHEGISVTWAGHATCILTLDDITIMTDPVFNSLPFFSRQADFKIAIDRLPTVDAVLLSHNHYDHMHMPSLYAMQNRSPKMHVAIPDGDKKWFDAQVFPSVEEYTWGEQFSIEKNNKKVTCTFVPSHHWTRRSLFDRNTSLWGSWIIEYDGQVFYFGGDSAYNTHFEEIGDLYNVDVALLPIGPIEPREHMKHSHLCPEEAGQAFLDLKAKQCIPIHWGTYGFGNDLFDEPIIRLQTWWKQNTQQLADKQLHCQKVGQPLTFIEI
jgi:L-ascorbate metabolism protein UlaG (beta-lactamase superfamily)